MAELSTLTAQVSALRTMPADDRHKAAAELVEDLAAIAADDHVTEETRLNLVTRVLRAVTSPNRAKPATVEAGMADLREALANRRGPGRPSTGEEVEYRIPSHLRGWVREQAKRRGLVNSNGEPIESAAVRAVLEEARAGALLTAERETNDDPAYLCGRLASVLHDLEYNATGNQTAWYSLFSQAVANPAIVLRWADRAPQWLDRLGFAPELAEHYRSEIARLTGRIGQPGSLANADSSSWFTLGYFHQQAPVAPGRAEV